MTDHIQEANRTITVGLQKMTPSEAMVETLVANGVTDMFGIMGSAFMDAMDIFAPAGIRLIPVVHEQGGGHACDRPWRRSPHAADGGFRRRRPGPRLRHCP